MVRLTLPLPLGALTDVVRIRFIQHGRHATQQDANWALDDIHLAPCRSACSGHGTCAVTESCVCDDGYSGADCSAPASPLPTSVAHDFERPSDVFGGFLKSSGFQLASTCGTVVLCIIIIRAIVIFFSYKLNNCWPEISKFWSISTFGEIVTFF